MPTSPLTWSIESKTWTCTQPNCGPKPNLDMYVVGATIQLSLVKNRQVHVPNFGGGWQGRRTSHVPPSLPPPLIFKAKLKIFCHPTLLKIRFQITVTPPSFKRWAKSKLRYFNKLSKPQVVVTHDNLFH